MKHTRIFAILLAFLLTGALAFGAVRTKADPEHPIEMSILIDPETRLETDGSISYMTFTLANRSDRPYTMYDAHLNGGFDGEERTLNGEITVAAGGTREFSLYDIPVSDEQLDTDITYVLTWTEILYEPAPTQDPTAVPATPEPTAEPDLAETAEQPGGGAEPATEAPTAEPEAETPGTVEMVEVRHQRSAEATVRIERFVPPELSVSAVASADMVAAGETFTVTYRIANETKYDMSGLELTDPNVFSGTIPLPGTDLMAGATITVPVEYTMSENDMVFHPVIRYIAAQRETVTEAKETLTVGAVVIGMRIDVQQYPSNEEGTTFAITVSNTGNRLLRNVQLYDEINTPIESAFDLAAQQQKVLTFNVPSAYSAGLIRTVRFHLTGTDYFGESFTYTDPNSYDCIPFVASDAVRLSLLVTLTNAYYDENGKLCGEIQFEIRNYSDVRITNAVLTELTLFGTVVSYDELQRGETFHSVVYQLDNVPNLAFRMNAVDPSGQTYATETIGLDLSQLATLASRTVEQTILYNNNTYLKDLVAEIEPAVRSVLYVTALLVVISSIICLILWFLEFRVKSQIPEEGLLAEQTEEEKPKPKGMDHVLAGAPPEQFGYTAPAKLRYYGASTITSRQNTPPTGKSKGSEEPFAAIKSRIDARKKFDPVLNRPQPNAAEAGLEEDIKVFVRPKRNPALDAYLQKSEPSVWAKPDAETPADKAQPAEAPIPEPESAAAPIEPKPASAPEKPVEPMAEPVFAAEEPERSVRATEPEPASEPAFETEQAFPDAFVIETDASETPKKPDLTPAAEPEPDAAPTAAAVAKPFAVAVSAEEPRPELVSEPEGLVYAEPEHAAAAAEREPEPAASAPEPGSIPVIAIAEPEPAAVSAAEPEADTAAAPEPLSVAKEPEIVPGQAEKPGVEPAAEKPAFLPETEPEPIAEKPVSEPEPASRQRAPEPLVLELHSLPARRALRPHEVVRIG